MLLMFTESCILVAVLLRLASMGIAALPMHHGAVTIWGDCKSGNDGVGETPFRSRNSGDHQVTWPQRLGACRKHPQDTCTDLPSVLLFAAIIENIEADLACDFTQQRLCGFNFRFAFEN